MKPRVLVVDDEPLIRTALSETIRRKGCESIVACDGEDGLLQFRRSPASLVFADVRMPRMDGLEFLKQIRMAGCPPRVVLITAYGSVETAVQAMKEGAYDFLMKPFSVKRVEEILERALTSEEPHPTDESTSAIVSRNPKILNLLGTIRRVADDAASILIQGESGTGKELFARQAHLWSKRRQGPFVAVNCAAIPESLLESELFGYERGAFTGAVTRRVGKFEAADGGTLLLDEISEMPAVLQAKLLRALQERTIDRVGGSRPVEIDIRVVATTNRDLKEEIRCGRFRPDLYYRLAVVPILLPPLRERKGDISLLARHFVMRYAGGAGSPVQEISPAAIKRLEEWSWPGNVRELESCIHRSILLCDCARLEPSDLILETLIEPATNDQIQEATGGSFRAMEKQLILDTLAKVGGNRMKAAEILGVSVRTIRNKLRDYREAGKILPMADREVAASSGPVRGTR
ncbi:MAG: sigma-54-dependent Fis family transcriptional regulator [Candidatus Methylomirabilota bacterium]|nr:sigma-54-dependent Fis family transcriptional regulator [candidate division NC10 bacterium]PWB43993.1 MAG: sigma-54-dependent Fis family transcriptional regulator [candidate division NC10 bacterium]